MMMATPESGPCTWSPAGTDLVTGACPRCHHAGLLHPSPANPSLPACVICMLLTLLPEDEQQRIEDQAKSLEYSDPPPSYPEWKKGYDD